MWKIKLFCLILILATMSTDAVKRVRRLKRRQAGSYASAGGYAGGYGGGYGGYTGGYSGDYGTGTFSGDYAPDYGFGLGFIDPYLFHQQLTAQILAQHAAQTNAIVTTSSSDNGQAWGEASMLPDNVQIQNQVGNSGYYGYKNHRYAPNFAAASGSIGPGGYHQTAYINPANPGSPNIVNRFGASSPGGYKGVSVSSFSSSSDINGRRTSNRGAQTTVNDNGRVTSYSVHS